MCASYKSKYNLTLTLNGWCTADTDSKVKRFERRPFVREKQKKKTTKYGRRDVSRDGTFFNPSLETVHSRTLQSTKATTTTWVVKTRCKLSGIWYLKFVLWPLKRFNTAKTILVSVLKSILKIDFISPRVHVVLSTWKCLRWRCLQNEDVVD